VFVDSNMSRRSANRDCVSSGIVATLFDLVQMLCSYGPRQTVPYNIVSGQICCACTSAWHPAHSYDKERSWGSEAGAVQLSNDFKAAPSSFTLEQHHIRRSSLQVRCPFEN